MRRKNQIRAWSLCGVLLLLVSPGRAGPRTLEPVEEIDLVGLLEDENEDLQVQLGDLKQRVASLEERHANPEWQLTPFGEELAWGKGEYKIVPYGIGWLNAAWDSSRTATGAFTLYVHSADTQGEPSFSVNARASRLGVDVIGPTILGARSSGKVELDFFGQALVENRASVLLRQAYGEFRTENWRLLGGQAPDVIAPLNPHMVNYTIGYGVGNIGYRRAQMRGEFSTPFFEAQTLTIQGSINRTIVTDFAEDPVAAGEDAGWPTLMARIALRNGVADAPEIGFSGHIGQEGVDFLAPPAQDDARFETWSANLDLSLPLTETMGFQGEVFVGEVLGTFQGGIIQAIDPGLRRGIHSIGGWGEAWYHLTEKLHTHAGFGIDDPRNSDLSTGRRTQNHVYYCNLLYHVTALFVTGLELSWWETRYQGVADGKSFRIETAMQYRF